MCFKQSWSLQLIFSKSGEAQVLVAGNAESAAAAESGRKAARKAGVSAGIWNSGMESYLQNAFTWV